jgi:hypothetical protein
MIEDSAAQSRADDADSRAEPAGSDADTSDAALLEEALQDAIKAHSAGLLAAPFGLDAIALARARRHAAFADQRRRTELRPGDSRSDSA